MMFDSGKDSLTSSGSPPPLSLMKDRSNSIESCGSQSPYTLGIVKDRSNSIELMFKSTSLVLPASFSIDEIEDLMELANKFEEGDEDDDDEDEEEVDEETVKE